ncbi:hypothetical protein PFISCL1PPCAC_20727, partial [Pristionchus fissidentatus]
SSSCSCSGRSYSRGRSSATVGLRIFRSDSHSLMEHSTGRVGHLHEILTDNLRLDTNVHLARRIRHFESFLLAEYGVNGRDVDRRRHQNVSSGESCQFLRAEIGHIRCHYGSDVAVRLRGIQPATNRSNVLRRERTLEDHHFLLLDLDEGCAKFLHAQNHLAVDAQNVISHVENVLADATVAGVDRAHNHLPEDVLHFQSKGALREQHDVRLEHLHRLRLLQLNLRHVCFGRGHGGDGPLHHERVFELGVGGRRSRHLIQLRLDLRVGLGRLIIDRENEISELEIGHQTLINVLDETVFDGDERRTRIPHKLDDDDLHILRLQFLVDSARSFGLDFGRRDRRRGRGADL